MESNVQAAGSNKHSSLLVAAVAQRLSDKTKSGVRSPTRETFRKKNTLAYQATELITTVKYLQSRPTGY
jgi:hypothetical protein